MANLLATKPLNLLMEEARETGEHSLKRTLGSLPAHCAGRGRDHRRRNFCHGGTGRAICRPRTHAVVRSVGLGMRVCRSLLRRVRRHDSAGRQRLHLRLCHAGRVAGVDHRLGPDPRIRHGRQHGVFGMVESLHRTAEYLSHQDAAVAGLRSLDCAEDCRKYGRAADGACFGSVAGSGHAGVSGQSECAY